VEKKDYRVNLELLVGLFPERAAISVKEAAEVLDSNINTVYAAIKRRKDPLPSKKLCGKTVIPIAGFARWMCL
jgi:predicted HTH domain antitoxin